MTPVRAVVFDYGHTLVHFALAEDRLLDCYERIRTGLASRLEREVPAAADLVESVSRRVEQLVQESYRRQELDEVDIVECFQTALAGVGLRVPRDEARGIAEYEHRCVAERLKVSEDNLRVLRDLRDLGLSIGLVSNAHFLPEMMWEDIRRLGIAQYVDDAVFSAEIGVRKPHPAIFMKVLNELNVQPKEAVFVGDRLRDDIGGAKALGMRGVLTHEFRQEALGSQPVDPDLVIDRLPELVPYVERLAKSHPERTAQ